MSSSGKNRNKTLIEELKAHNLDSDLVINTINDISDNNNIPSFLFMLGFLLGDGSLYVRFRLKKCTEDLVDKNSIWFIPALSLPQINMESNINLFNKFEILFQSYNVTYSITKSAGNKSKVLIVEGPNNIFVKLLPYFNSYSHFFFGKKIIIS